MHVWRLPPLTIEHWTKVKGGALVTARLAAHENLLSSHPPTRLACNKGNPFSFCHDRRLIKTYSLATNFQRITDFSLPKISGEILLMCTFRQQHPTHAVLVMPTVGKHRELIQSPNIYILIPILEFNHVH